MKIIVTLIPINLVTNWLLSLFCLFHKPKTRTVFLVSWWSGNKKYFGILFIVSRALLQRHENLINKKKKIFFFLDVIPDCL